VRSAPSAAALAVPVCRPKVTEGPNSESASTEKPSAMVSEV
jgi:hypothetical protein